MSSYIEESYIPANTDKDLQGIFKFWCDNNFTAMFEWVSNEDPIVLKYTRSDLILTAVRHNKTGNSG